jgi:nucleoside-diphosphate-sugar epimerase
MILLGQALQPSIDSYLSLLFIMAVLVLITGGTGFIGSHVINETLKAGYNVRLTIRKPKQARTVIKRYPEHKSRIETALVPDMSKSEYFKDALKDVDYVFHIASPMPGSGPDVRSDYVDPAVQATEAVLFGAMEFSKIQKVVLMSSILALMPVDAFFSKNATVNGINSLPSHTVYHSVC